MRISILGALAASALAVCACNPDTPTNEATESIDLGSNPESKVTRAAATGTAGDTETAAIWASLDAFVGKGPVESGLLDKSAIGSELQKLLGDKVTLRKTNLETSAPLQRDGSNPFTSGNKDNQGGTDAAYLLIDPKTEALGLWEKGELSTYKTAGATITKPNDVETMIANIKALK